MNIRGNSPLSEISVISWNKGFWAKRFYKMVCCFYIVVSIKKKQLLSEELVPCSFNPFNKKIIKHLLILSKCISVRIEMTSRNEI